MIRSIYRIGALVLCAFALLLAGCHQEAPAPSTTTLPAVAPLEQYTLARLPVDRAEHLILTYSMSETRTVGASTLPREVTGTASYSGAGKKDMVAVVEESLHYGSYTASYTEAYCDSLAYAVVNGSYFSAQLTADAFMDRQIPAVLLTGELYESVTREYTQDSVVLTFSQPARLEPWVTSEKTTLVSASGAAVLDAAGNLLRTDYRAEYLLGDIHYSLELSVRITIPKSLDLGAKHPAHDQDCTNLESLDALKYLMQAVGDVYAAQQISCQSEETILSEAIPLSYAQTGSLTLSGFNTELAASALYSVTLSDYRGQVTSQTQIDRFENGVFTTQVNDGEPMTQDWVTAKQMRLQAEDKILSGLMAVKYIGGAALTNNGSTIRLDFTGNDAFCTDLMKTITDFLKVDLDAAAEAVQTGQAGGYLVIRKDSGLPVELGIHLRRVHTINTVVYELSHTLRETLLFG